MRRHDIINTGSCQWVSKQKPCEKNHTENLQEKQEEEGSFAGNKKNTCSKQQQAISTNRAMGQFYGKNEKFTIHVLCMFVQCILYLRTEMTTIRGETRKK